MDGNPQETTSFRPMSQGSARFRHSVYTIPTPGVEVQRPKRYEPLILKWWILASIAMLFIGLALGLEIALSLSNKWQGFNVSSTSVFGFASTQFFIHFFTTIMSSPLVALWEVTDQMLRWYQPYVTLANGHASAQESLLLDYVDYVEASKLRTLFFSLRHKHWLIHISAIAAISTILLQPLAGSVLEIRQTTATAYTGVTSTHSVGLDPSVFKLNAFVASAGFAEAAVFNGLPDPSFIQGGWAAAEFVFPENPVLNGSMIVDTVGIQTQVNCALPATFNLNTPGSGNYTIQSTSAQGCSNTATFDPSSSEQQYGVSVVSNCGSASSINFQPVMFWYFHLNSQQKPEARGVFCQPTIGIFNIKATANLNNGSLANVTVLNDYAPSNNVTGSPMNGQAFNGVVFDTTSEDRFVQARATATNSGVPGAIFRFATQQKNGPQGTFDDPNGFLNITNHVYTQHLALVAKSVYFIPDEKKIQAQMTSLIPKLWVEPLAAHALAILLLGIGLAGLFIHIQHRRARRNLWLTSPPGSIASIVALTSRSGFGELMLPYDDKLAMQRKLSGLRFYLDQRTGAILADDDESEHYAHMGPDDALMSLLGKKPQQPPPPTPSYPTWQQEQTPAAWHQFKTPYDP